jgi:hypothetical protein
VFEDQLPYWQRALCLLSAVMFSLSLGMVRERSQSLLPAVLFHLSAALAALMVVRYI